MSKSYRTGIFVLVFILNTLFVSLIWGFIGGFFPSFYPFQLAGRYLLSFGLPIVIYFFITKEPVREALSLRPVSIENLLRVILISLFIQPLMMLASFLSSFVFSNNVSGTLSSLSDVSVFWLTAALAVIPAFFEELVFRGIVLSGYRGAGLKKSCLVCGLAFGIMHLDGQQFLYAFLMGVIFSWLVCKTRSILSSMMSHFIINFTQVFLFKAAYSAAGGLSENVPAEILPTFAVLAIMCILTIPVLAALFYSLDKSNPDIFEQKAAGEAALAALPVPKEKILTAPLAATLVIYALFVALPLFI